MAMSIFSIGDVVQLKSGGPLMTVESTGPDTSGRERVLCVWFDSKESQQKNSFAVESLEKIDDNEPLEPIIG